MNLRCPYCDSDHDSDQHPCFGAGPAVPHGGDILLCTACGSWGIFEHDAIRAPNAIELRDINRNPECLRIMNAWLQLMKLQRAAAWLKTPNAHKLKMPPQTLA